MCVCACVCALTCHSDLQGLRVLNIANWITCKALVHASMCHYHGGDGKSVSTDCDSITWIALCSIEVPGDIRCGDPGHITGECDHVSRKLL